MFAVGQQWMAEALCAQSDPEAWFPDREQPKDNHRQEAMKTCRRCPVRLRCLQYALEEKITYGIWGGVAERERRQLAARRAKANR